MIRFFDGTVFNTNACAIVNTINTVGVMGAGIALEFSLRYPEMYEDYLNKCEGKLLTVGKVDYYKDKSDITIVNFPTKIHFRYPSQLKWIEEGLKNFSKTYHSQGIRSIAFPKLGAGHGGLDWSLVKPLMEEYLGDLDMDVIICLDEKNEAEGMEKKMLESFNSFDLEKLNKNIRLTKNQKKKLELNKPFKRFWKIKETESIGAKTYEELFKFFYKNEEKNPDKKEFIIEQQSFFDS